MSGPCEWPVSYLGCPGVEEPGIPPEPLASMTPEERERVEQIAVEYLWNWTGQTLGTCEVTVQPCRDDCQQGVSTFNGSGPGGSGGSMWRPVLIDGLWYNVGCGRCQNSCSCSYVSSLRLPGPVASIVEVVIDGTPLDPAAYRVDNYRYLIRQDGGDWPSCNDFSVAPGSEGTWSVTYARGVEVPVAGQVAAGVLAVEFAKALCRDSSCQLPQRVQTVTRQGVTVAMLDSFDDVDKGHTGIWVIDSWLASVMNSSRRFAILSPDVARPAHRRTTWQDPGI